TTADGLGAGEVLSIVADSDGTIWISTWGGGVSHYDGKTFKKFTADDGLIDNSVTSIYKDKDGTFWFGTFRGVSHFDGKKFTNFSEEDGFLLRETLTAIHRDSQGAMWFASGHLGGYGGDGAWRYDGQSFVHFTATDGL